MAKMKVHELAKELDKKSKDLIDYLQAKGYEVKVAQSSIEDEAIDLVRRQFGSAAAKETNVQTKEQTADKGAEAKAKVEDKVQQTADKPAHNKAVEAAPKAEEAKEARKETAR